MSDAAEFFAKCDAAGQIDSVGYCGPGLAAMQSVPDGWTCVVLPDRTTHDAVLAAPRSYRLLAGEIVPRAVMAPSISAASFAADGVAECVIAGLPDPCRVVLGGAAGNTTIDLPGGTLTITSSEPGRITMRITADPTHAPWKGAVIAV